MLTSLETALENLGWEQVEDGPVADTISFEILALGFESNDDGRFPEYSLMIYAKYQDYKIDRNEALVTACKQAIPLIYTAAGTYDVEADIEENVAEVTFINLRDRQ